MDDLLCVDQGSHSHRAQWENGMSQGQQGVQRENRMVWGVNFAYEDL